MSSAASAAASSAAAASGIPFLSSVPVSAALLVIGIVLFVVMCYKGIHTAVSAIIASAIVALGSSTGFLDTITTTWSKGLGDFALQSGLAFISAGLFSYLMRETRSGEAIADKFIKIIGADHSPYIIAVTAAVLQLAGIQSYIFIVATMTFSLMKQANLPIYIGYAACIAVPPIITFTMPGVTAMPNVLPTTFLGTTTWAAPVLSLATAATGIVLMILYMQHLIKQARKNNIGYTTDAENEYGASKMFGDIELPAFWKSVLPIILVIVLAAVFQLGIGWSAMNALNLRHVDHLRRCRSAELERRHPPDQDHPRSEPGLHRDVPLHRHVRLRLRLRHGDSAVRLLQAPARHDHEHQPEPLHHLLAVCLPDRRSVRRRCQRHGHVAVHLRQPVRHGQRAAGFRSGQPRRYPPYRGFRCDHLRLSASFPDARLRAWPCSKPI